MLEKKSKKQEIRNTALMQLLDSQEKYNLKLDDTIAIMADLLFGGVDTVILNLYKNLLFYFKIFFYTDINFLTLFSL